MKILKSLRTQIMKLFWYNLFTFPVLMVFYIPYQLFWIGLSPIQLVKYIATAGFFGSVVNIIMRPVVAWVTRFNDKRYGKKLQDDSIQWGCPGTFCNDENCLNHAKEPLNTETTPSVKEEK